MKVLWVGDGGIATGFARVNHSIIEHLPADEFDVHHLAVNYNGDPYETPKHHKLYPAGIGGDALGYKRIRPMINGLKPDVVFILGDPWVINDYISLIPQEVKIVAYTPVDAKPLEEVWVKNLSTISQLVTYTEFGKSAFTDLNPELEQEIKVIPHGVNTSTFYPMDRNECYKALGLPEDIFNKEAFIVFNGNRNQPRKRIDLTLKAFAKFVQGKPDNVFLYLHMGNTDAGWNVMRLARNYGIANRIIMTDPRLSPGAAATVEQLNMIYNTADIGINTSMGEGWGLINVEQACCKIPQIVPNYAATAEIFNKNEALHIDIERFEPHQHILTEGGIINVDHAADLMDKLYYDKDLREQLGRNAYNKFTSPEYSWKAVADQFADVLRDVHQRPPKLIETQEVQEVSQES